MKIAFVVPDGVGVKNYLYSSVVDNLVKQNCEVLVYHSLGNDFSVYLSHIHPNIKIHQFKKSSESALIRFTRELACHIRLKFNTSKAKNETIMRNWKKFHTLNFKKQFLYRMVETVSYFIRPTYRIITRIEKYWIYRTLKSETFKFWKKTFFTIQPDLIFLTHQRVTDAAAITEAARVVGAKSITAIFSWDNISKARLNVKSGYYAVWSNYMKEELKFFYPEISSDKIIVFGSPQFEFYRDKKFDITREEFYQLNNIPLDKKIICFSGDDLLTSPHDPKYLEDLCSALDKHPKKDELAILVRPAPADLTKRFDEVINKYPFAYKATLNIEEVKTNLWSNKFPDIHSIKILVGTVKFSETVVNVGSTMALDFFNLKKHAFYINYDVVKDKNWSTKIIYQYEHFKSMVDLDSVDWINNKEDWDCVLNHALNPISATESSMKWLQTINEYESLGGGDSFALKLKKIGKSK